MIWNGLLSDDFQGIFCWTDRNYRCSAWRMPAALDVDKEAVRTLVIAVGVREAARRMGLAEGTVQDWSATGGWVAGHKAALATAPSSKAVQPHPTKAADALSATLAQRKEKTHLYLSKYVESASKQASQASDKLSIAQDVKAVASVASTLWPADSNGPQITVNLMG